MVIIRRMGMLSAWRVLRGSLLLRVFSGQCVSVPGPDGVTASADFLFIY